MNKSDVKKYASAFENYQHMIHGADYNPDQWLEMPEIIDEDMRLMKVAGINSVSLAIFAWKALEPQEGVYNFAWLDDIMDRLALNDIKVMLATPSGARPTWMDRDHPEVLRVASNRIRNLHGARHNHCYTSPYYRKKVKEMNTLLANRYKDHKALAMWHISNEYGGECHCELCQEAFRNWLRVKYHNDIHELNEQWWTYFWSHTFSSFDEIESPAPHGEMFIHGLNLDWKRFVTEQTKTFFLEEISPIKEITPNIPVTTNLQGTYDGLDPWKMAPVMDYISWDNYPAWHNTKEKVWETASDISFIHDINRTLKGGKPFLLMESTPSQVNWHEVNKLKKPKMNALSSIQAIAHGADSVQYFQWRKGRGASEKFHGAVLDHYGKADTRVFKEVTQLGENLKKLDDIVGTTVKPEVAVIFDWENKWAIFDLQGLNQERDYEKTCKEHYRAFWEKGISVDVINMDCSFDEYKMVVAPMLYMLKPGVSERLKNYVAKGGNLVLTYCTGYVNENDLCFLGGYPGGDLQEVAGIWAEEIDPLYPDEINHIVMKEKDGFIREYKCHSLCEIIHKKTCEVMAVYGEDFYKDYPVVTKNKYEKGTCYYIASRPEEKFLEDFYQQIGKQSGINQCLPIDLPKGVTLQQRYGDGSVYYFLMNFTEVDQQIYLKNGEMYTDVVTGKKLDDTVVLKAYEYLIFKKYFN